MKVLAWPRMVFASAPFLRQLCIAFMESVAAVLPFALHSLQSITQSHYFIHLGDDAFLFVQWWEANDQVQQNRLIQVLHCCSDS